MAESITISPLPPEQKSMQYELLRTQGLEHIQKLASKVWTDYNISDPGITILEVLSYVITDLGYRISYNMPDILAHDPSTLPQDIKNFYTARQILPMRPVTFNDYRKLLIDVEVHDPLDLDCPVAGVKNAWIEKSPTNEIPVYVDRLTDSLSYTPADPNNPEQLDIKVLYDILLEFDRCENLGDLNENTLEKRIKLYPCTTLALDNKLVGVGLKIEVEFPRWDDADVDWTDRTSIINHLKTLTLDFTGLPSGYAVQGYGFFPDKTVWVSITNNNIAVNTTCIVEQIESVIYNNLTDNLVDLYQKKVKKVLQIVEEVRAKLMDNRNLCEDFFNINALRVEQIAICADIQVTTNADIEQVLAEMYFRIGNFLSPTVYFYTLDEMFNKGYGSEEIFEGPALDHGFIDTNELKKADRKKSIHVSDLIQIIMDIPGVLAVKNIQIANIPLDNDSNIPSLSVKWCLQLAFDKNYVPRLTTERSNITFFKDLLPYAANEEEVDAILEDLIKEQRPQKLHDIPLDLPVPEGTWRDIENYVSVQDEFPLNYGIGPEGLPASSSDLRKAQAKQLKGFLMFFDQLLADYLSQLAHVKDLFSMNGETNTAGDFVIDKSYFTQSLIPYVSDVNPLLVNPVTYPANLQSITESEALFEERRNRFLDHLMARFCEQFTDYALLVYKLDGPKAPKELLVDKLRFLNDYPDISGGRFRAFNYESPCELWHIDNTSGLEKRMTLLTGIDERKASTLFFTIPYEIAPVLGGYKYYLPNTTLPIIESFETFLSVDQAKLGIEKLIINGVNDEKYLVVDSTGKVVTNDGTGFTAPFYPAITCGKMALAWDISVSYLTPANAAVALPGLITAFLSDFTNEYFNNPESNRNNLACPILNYYETSMVTTQMAPNPPYYEFDFTLYQDPFNFGPSFVQLLTGTHKGYGDCKTSTPIISVVTSPPSIRVSGDLSPYIVVGDPVTIKDSAANDNPYLVTAVILHETLPGVFETELGLNALVISGASPFGNLLYNKQSDAELTQIGEDNIEKDLFNISQRGISLSNYGFSDPTLPSPYVFHILDKCGDPIATSVETDFNNALAIAIENHQGTLPPDTIAIVDSTANNANYTVNNATAIGSEIEITVDETIPSSIADGFVEFGESNFDVLGVDTDKNQFNINSPDLSRKIFPGESFTIYGLTPNDGIYLIKNIFKSGSTTIIETDEPIPSPAVAGKLSYIKKLAIIRIEQNQPLNDDKIFVKGGADDYALQQMINFLKLKFFTHEGIHLAEHILLRPKRNGQFFIDFTDGGKELATSLSTLGNLTFMHKLPLFSIDLPNNMFFVTGNLTTELTPLQNIAITGSTGGVNDGVYTILTVGISGPQTGIKVLQTIPDDALANIGDFNYQLTEPILSNTTTQVVINIPDTEIAGEFNASITGSENGVNDGVYTVGTVSGSPATITFIARQTLIKDDLLQVNLLAECESCTFKDPYSFLATTIMPVWQGRFSNDNFRTFFDRSIRLECPAHLMLNVCWIDCEQMKNFEYTWKKWILENSKKDKNQKAISEALNELIAVLIALRSSYPEGTLHDCETDDTLNNAIILNKTVLGTL